MKQYKNCQSCGMPMNKDPEHGGTEKDGTRSQKYCSYCYDDGEFRSPDMTVSEMQTLVKEQLKKMHFPGFLAGLFAKGVPKLERWNKA